MSKISLKEIQELRKAPKKGPKQPSYKQQLVLAALAWRHAMGTEAAFEKLKLLAKAVDLYEADRRDP